MVLRVSPSHYPAATHPILTRDVKTVSAGPTSSSSSGATFMRYLIELAPVVGGILNLVSAVITATASRPRRRGRRHLGPERPTVGQESCLEVMPPSQG